MDSILVGRKEGIRRTIEFSRETSEYLDGLKKRGFKIGPTLDNLIQASVDFKKQRQKEKKNE